MVFSHRKHYSRIPYRKNPQFSLMFIIFFTRTMAGSSEHISFADQSAFVIMLNVKNGQNVIIDLESSRYEEVLRPIIECLTFLPLNQELTMAESILIVHLSNAYSSSIYTKVDEVASHKTMTTKARFCIHLGFTSSDALVDEESISNIALIEMFYEMGFIGEIPLLSKSKNSFLPPMWNELFTILFKSFSERVARLDSASKLFYTLIYGLYHGINMVFGVVLWSQFIQSIVSTTRQLEISCARFWSIVVNHALGHFKVPLMTDLVIRVIPSLQTSKFMMLDPINFTFVGTIP